ncbi:MAG: TraB/GumN family protein [Thermoplasmata archaeon]|nr:TraB/GumN family protein [Thermoplasmata archaeon]
MYASTTQSPVLLIGAAHVVDLEAPLRATLGGRSLDAVAIELDPERADVVLSENPPEPGARPNVPLFVRLWSVLQKRLGEQIGGGMAGAEMRTAAQVAKELGLPLFLIDDPIRETLGRLVRSMSFKERVSLVVGGIVGLFVPARWVEDQLEDYNETPEQYLAQVREAYPAVARVLLDDRNEHMADRLTDLRNRGYGRVASVVGDAHLPGLAAALKRRGVPVETVSFAQLRGPKAPSTGSS